MFAKILVPVDGSEGSWSALESAADIAQKFSSEIVVCNVVQNFNEITLLAIPMERVALTQKNEALEEIGKQVLDIAKEKLSAHTGKVEYILDSGNPSERIISLAKEKECDGIVIGSRGLSGIAEFFLGSVSSKVSQYANIPVVIIK